MNARNLLRGRLDGRLARQAPEVLRSILVETHVEDVGVSSSRTMVAKL